MPRQLIERYKAEVEKIIKFGASKQESSIKNAFYNLLNTYCENRQLILVPELKYKTGIIPDGTIKDHLRLDRGYWESKDENDDLEIEIQKKFGKGYPKDNILFEDSQTAVLYQNGIEVFRVSFEDDKALDEIINLFVGYERPEINDFRIALDKFKEDIPVIMKTLREMIDNEEKTNPEYRKTRDTFLEICKKSINPDIVENDIREMMIQHILTEDIFTTVFSDAQFHQENNIAVELNKIIKIFFKGEIKHHVLSSIESYYLAIKSAASNISDHHEKQNFLKILYENFYRAYNPKGADRLGIFYTPNEIVNFMIEGTDFLLNKHFNRLLSDENVEILDPATGTGTFITDIIDYIPRKQNRIQIQKRNPLQRGFHTAILYRQSEYRVHI